MEKILRIYWIILKIDEQKYTSEENLKDIIKKIGNQLEEIQNRCNIYNYWKWSKYFK